jgi:ribosomal protein S12 methylthiotransferase accessory factor YcaO
VSEIIERMAMAIWELRRQRASKAGIELAKWEDELEGLRQDVRAEVRVSLEAAREPTGAMVIAGRYPAGGGPEAEATWEAMIDAALDNGK